MFRIWYNIADCKTILLVQALKSLGKERATQEVIRMLSDKLTAEEKTAALKEAAESTDWIYDAIKKICEDNEKWEKTVRLSDEEWAGLFGNTADKMKLHDAIVEKDFSSLFDMSEIFSDHHFRKIFNFYFYGERSDFDFCPISENWQRLA